MLEADHVTISDDVTFGKGVILKGTVHHMNLVQMASDLSLLLWLFPSTQIKLIPHLNRFLLEAKLNLILMNNILSN